MNQTTEIAGREIIQTVSSVENPPEIEAESRCYFCGATVIFMGRSYPHYDDCEGTFLIQRIDKVVDDEN